MMRRIRKVKQFFEKVRIIDAGSEGNAVGRIDDKVIFVPFVVPGDLIDVSAFKNKKSFYEGKAVRIHEYSEKRTEPLCEHFGICGGCRWQNMKYNDQLFYKQKQVLDSIERIGKFEHPEILPILPSEKEFYYRNKLEFTFSNKKWLTDLSKGESPESRIMNGLGFHIPGMFDRIVDLENCYLQDEPSNSIRKEIKNFTLEHHPDYFDARKNTGFLRNLIIRNTTTGEVMVLLVFHYDDREKINGIMDHIYNLFPGITSLMFVINEKKNDTISDLPVHLYKGKDHLIEAMDGLKYRIGPVSFFQTNSLQVRKLYKITREFADLKGNEIVFDLYTGTGTIANYIAAHCHKVIGIESVPAAIEDAEKNSEINQITNTQFFSGDIVNVMDDDFILQNGKPDVIITDPPRAGMHEKVIQQILKMEPERIVYISCNPATQARDVALMIEKYKVEKIQPVDMFPHTMHVENVMLLRRR
jgi:23S rRNA (uracil1939-C5)-methyltransferase